MAQNNLRILYNNTLTAAVGGASPSNLLNDYKSQTSTASTFTLTTNSLTGKIAVVAMLSEDTGPVTMTVSGYYTDQQTTVIETTQGMQDAAVGQGGGKYVAAYITLPAAATTFTIAFSKTVKVSRFIIGNYWSPTYNTSFGVQVGYEDLSTTERLQGGDLYTTLGPRYKTINFELSYLTDTDKFKLFDIIKLIGKSRPMFISIFPQDTDKEKEQMYSIYGKLQNLAPLSYAMFTKYTSNIQIEEV